MRCSNCGKCCEKTEMELSNKDIKRLEEAGYRRASGRQRYFQALFSVLQLFTDVLSFGHTAFLSPASHMISILLQFGHRYTFSIFHHLLFHLSCTKARATWVSLDYYSIVLQLGPNTEFESSRLICDVPYSIGSSKIFALTIVKPDYSVFAFGMSAET